MFIWEKIKSFGKRFYAFMEDYGRRRAQRALSLELAHYHRIEHHHKHQTRIENPYSIMFRHDKY